MMEQNQRRRFWMLGPMVVVALLSGVLIGKGWERTGHATETYEELRTFSEVLSQVQKNYVDETKVKDLVQGAIRGMLSTLDPHSAYMTPEMYKEMQVETKGEFGGVGIQIGVKENRLAVIAPIDGTPAQRAGIKAGDYITKVNEESTKDLSLMDAVQKMRGPKGTKVNLTIQRDGTTDPLQFTLVREIKGPRQYRLRQAHAVSRGHRARPGQSPKAVQGPEGPVHDSGSAQQPRRSAHGSGGSLRTVSAQRQARRLYKRP
jgi:carboxyl-terminal processing protease